MIPGCDKSMVTFGMLIRKSYALGLNGNEVYMTNSKILITTRVTKNEDLKQ